MRTTGDPTEAVRLEPDCSAVLGLEGQRRTHFAPSGRYVQTGGGRQDTWSPLSRHQEMHALFPQSRLVVIENSGHMSTMEQPAAVSDALASWMNTGTTKAA